jgi:hypothetical protein
MADHEPRIYLHEDGRYLSIGFTDTNDTLLKMPDQGEGWRDWERAAEWVAAVDKILKEHAPS